MSGKVKMTRAGRTWHVYVNGELAATLQAHNSAGVEEIMDILDTVANVARRLGAEVER
jgi:hypothetical protein